MDGTVYVYPQYRSPVTLLGHGTCLEPPTRCTTTGRSVCQIPFGAWKLDSARYSFDKHCLSTFCPPTIHRLSSAADAFHRSAAAAAAVAAAAVNGTGGGVATGGGGGNNSSSSSNNNNNSTTNASGSNIATVQGSGGGGGNAISIADTAAAACYNLHSSAAASVAAAVSGFIPTMSSHSGAHTGPHHHTSAGATPSLIQAAAAAARQQTYLSDAKHPALTFTSPLSGAQKLLPSAEAFPSILPVFADSLSQLNYGRKVFPCPQCRYTTDRRNNLKRHMLTMHQACSKLLECCGILFTTKASLREHALIFHYHGYTCFYCGRRFCRKALLKRHLSVHNGQKDFVCSVCDYATSHKSNLERHRKVHVRQDSDGKDAGIICVDGSSSSNSNNVHNTSGSNSSNSGTNSHHNHPHNHSKNTNHSASSSTPSGAHCTKTSSHSDDDDDDDDEDELLCVDSQHVEGRPHHLHRSHPDMKHEVNDSDDDVSICLDDEEVHVN